MNECLHGRWYYRTAGAWCPECKQLFRPRTPEYEELVTANRIVCDYCELPGHTVDWCPNFPPHRCSSACADDPNCPVIRVYDEIGPPLTDVQLAYLQEGMKSG